MSSNGIFQDFIKAYQSFIICTHINPDPDALGSVVALYKFLKCNNYKAYIVLEDAVPHNLKFMLSEYDIYTSITVNKVLEANQAVITLDCSNKSRIGINDDHCIWQKQILNIDHHPDNSRFGTRNIVVDDASSTGEIIYDLIIESVFPHKLNTKIAEAIYVAIIGDTGGFRYSNTTARVHDIAANLFKFDIRAYVLNEQVLERQSLVAFELVRKALNTVKVDSGIASMVISNQMLATISQEEMPELINYIRSLSGVKVAVVFTEVDKNLIKISFRSKPPIDISRVAREFGGGGHKYASGCRVKGELAHCVTEVLDSIIKLTSNEVEKN